LTTIPLIDETRHRLEAIDAGSVWRPARLLEHYSRFKLGFLESIDIYARALAPVLQKRVERDTDDTRWLVTGPPRMAVPAAANILAERVVRQLTPHDRILLHELRKTSDVDRFPTDHYGGMDVEARRSALLRSSERWRLDERFSGAAVLVINDVCVTGAQEQMLRHFFIDLGARRVHWQYVFEVEALARHRASHIETALNESTISSADDFVRAAHGAELRITSKLLWRLFSWDDERFGQALVALGATRRREILDLLRKEGLANNSIEQSKLAMLGCRHSARKNLTA
jgi:PRTase ComF-like